MFAAQEARTQPKAGVYFCGVSEMEAHLIRMRGAVRHIVNDHEVGRPHEQDVPDELRNHERADRSVGVGRPVSLRSVGFDEIIPRNITSDSQNAVIVCVHARLIRGKILAPSVNEKGIVGRGLICRTQIVVQAAAFVLADKGGRAAIKPEGVCVGMVVANIKIGAAHIKRVFPGKVLVVKKAAAIHAVFKPEHQFIRSPAGAPDHGLQIGKSP